MEQRKEKPEFPEYVIFQTGGKQYQGIPGKTVAVEKLDGEPGDAVEITDVLFRKKGEGEFEIGQPTVEGATLKASILKHDKGKKIIVFKFKRRKKYRVKQGHRQPMTILRIESI